MGNTQAQDSRHAVDEKLMPQLHQVVALPPDLRESPSNHPLVLSAPTKLRVEHYPHKDLSVFDHATGELLFRYDQRCSADWTERKLVDGHGKPVLKMTKELVYSRNYFLQAPSDAAPASSHKQPYKLTSVLVRDVLEMELKLTDQTSGEPCIVRIDGDWKSTKR